MTADEFYAHLVDRLVTLRAQAVVDRQNAEANQQPRRLEVVHFSRGSAHAYARVLDILEEVLPEQRGGRPHAATRAGHGAREPTRPLGRKEILRHPNRPFPP